MTLCGVDDMYFCVLPEGNEREHPIASQASATRTNVIVPYHSDKSARRLRIELYTAAPCDAVCQTLLSLCGCTTLEKAFPINCCVENAYTL